MAFGFSSIGHFFASVGKDIVKFAKAAGPVVNKIDKTVEANLPLIEGLSALVSPKAPAIEDAAYALFGKVAHAISEASDAANANGLNLALDAQTVADMKSLLPAVEQFAIDRGIYKPASTKVGT